MSDPPLTLPYWKREVFELGHNIDKFTHNFLSRNNSRQPPPTREEVSLHWSWQVMKAYPNSAHPKRILLLDQVSCPLAETLWEKRRDEEALKRKRAKQAESGFYVIDRSLTEPERKKHPFAVIMTHSVHGEIIVPDIALYPLNKISYLDLVRKILAANPSKDLDLFMLNELWDAILSKVYDYEYDWREGKKNEGKHTRIREYFEAVADVAEPKKRKHSEVEEESTDSDAQLAETEAEIAAKSLEAAEGSIIINASAPTAKQVTTPKAFIKDKGSDQEAHDTPLSGNRALTKTKPAEASSKSAVKPTHPSIPPKKKPLFRRLSYTSPPPSPKQTPSLSNDSSRPHHPPPRPSSSSAHQQSSLSANNDAPQWPYDPDTGVRTSFMGQYRLSQREAKMLSYGVPPWAYDPRTGKEAKISTGSKSGRAMFPLETEYE